MPGIALDNCEVLEMEEEIVDTIEYNYDDDDDYISVETYLDDDDDNRTDTGLRASTENVPASLQKGKSNSQLLLTSDLDIHITSTIRSTASTLSSTASTIPTTIDSTTVTQVSVDDIKDTIDTSDTTTVPNIDTTGSNTEPADLGRTEIVTFVIEDSIEENMASGGSVLFKHLFVVIWSVLLTTVW